MNTDPCSPLNVWFVRLQEELATYRDRLDNRPSQRQIIRSNRELYVRRQRLPRWLSQPAGVDRSVLRPAAMNARAVSLLVENAQLNESAHGTYGSVHRAWRLSGTRGVPDAELSNVWTAMRPESAARRTPAAERVLVHPIVVKLTPNNRWGEADAVEVVTRGGRSVTRAVVTRVHRDGTYDLRPIRSGRAMTRIPTTRIRPTEGKRIDIANGFFVESFIHRTLFCAMRTLMRGSNRRPEIAKVPKIEAIGTCYDDIRDTDVYYCAQGNIAGPSFHGVFGHGASSRANVAALCTAIVQIASLLEVLQARFHFVHRDMNVNNLMCHRPCDARRPADHTLQWYIIDFGFSRIELDGRVIEYTDPTVPSRGAPIPFRHRAPFNRSQDLRLLFTGSWTTYPCASIRQDPRYPALRRVLKPYVQRIRGRRYPRYQDERAHDFYQQVITDDDELFRPQNVIRDFQGLAHA
jgi:hypothetical protein